LPNYRLCFKLSCAASFPIDQTCMTNLAHKPNLQPAFHHNSYEELIGGHWYYTVEYAPGYYTPGQSYPNVSLSRHLLSHCDVAGSVCLDSGVQEGLISTLLAKRGGKVTAIDAGNMSKKVAFVKDLHGVDYDYYPHVQLDRQYEFLRQKQQLENFGNPPIPEDGYCDFDVVVLSGLIYHVFSPLHALGYARSMLREGGIMIVETGAMLRPDYVAQHNFNGEGYYYSWSDTWLWSVPLLDYMLRFCRLAPLECVYLKSSSDIVRIGVACRAIPDVLPDVKETAMMDSTRNFDYCQIIRRPQFKPGATDVRYIPSIQGTVMREHTKTCDLYRTLLATKPYEPTPDECVLRLNAMY